MTDAATTASSSSSSSNHRPTSFEIKSYSPTQQLSVPPRTSPPLVSLLPNGAMGAGGGFSTAGLATAGGSAATDRSDRYSSLGRGNSVAPSSEHDDGEEDAVMPPLNTESVSLDGDFASYLTYLKGDIAAVRSRVSEQCSDSSGSVSVTSSISRARGHTLRSRPREDRHFQQWTVGSFSSGQEEPRGVEFEVVFVNVEMPPIPPLKPLIIEKLR
eukprot:gnl/Hemi2/27647_TR9136_c0_g1_i1.p1 gnl/Hemi2/27647_TR9136_c0_g1~~gnl/Hemi2/27647_TR9136_c0_g1_i1.p1  ORF type:complete len:214 (+),score=27.21 gnl/Hemi2/27647_TR9136_c0_g1_i1:93-734(+)